MQFLQTDHLTEKQLSNIFELWNSEYPAILNYEKQEQFFHYLNGLEKCNHFLLMNDNDTVVGWAFTFIREGERNFGIMISSEFHGQGYGTVLLDYLKKSYEVLNGWVIDKGTFYKKNGAPYSLPAQFYIKNGFEVNEKEFFETDLFSSVRIKWRKR